MDIEVARRNRERAEREFWQAIEQAHRNGVTMREIARRSGLSKSAVDRALPKKRHH